MGLEVQLRVNGQEELARPVGELRALWEATSFQLERLQASPHCVEQEERGLARRQGPTFTLTFDPEVKPPLLCQMGEGRGPWEEGVNTFSLGVCNGCQLMALLGWVGGESPQSDPTGGAVRPGVLLAPNDSGRFESRFVALAIEESPAVMLRGMAGSTLGIWVAHGEDRRAAWETLLPPAWSLHLPVPQDNRTLTTSLLCREAVGL
ncbi:nucleoside-triphosphate diphosphatase [Platysternon megacephalum]|uniref:Nucleoside-triphosphate diphosphatase n=1 Tax=Platysternon megacephalum TaxID=55544 RepID=A0A4D9DHQ5_9SAUR|nr:nucleoside-triphosphate diphosphatase [Platysternon megacephalum]